MVILLILMMFLRKLSYDFIIQSYTMSFKTSKKICSKMWRKNENGIKSLRLRLDNLKVTERNGTKRNETERSGAEQRYHSIIWIFHDGMELIFHSIVLESRQN